MSDTFRDFHRFTVPDQSVRTGTEAISAVLDLLAESERLTAEQRQGILKALQDRETLGSTGIGRGLAVPHAKYSGLAQLIGAVANFQPM